MKEEGLEEKGGEHPFGDGGQVILFVVFVIVWAADSFFLHWTTFLAAEVPLALRLVVGAAVAAAALWLMKSGHVVAGGEEGPREIVRSGAFRYVRHPLYLGSLLMYLAFTIATLSLLASVVFVGIFLFYDYIAGYEERLLLAKFGERYRDYQGSAGKWAPKKSRGSAVQTGSDV